MKNNTLMEYGKNIFSQYGEDGILEEILRITGTQKGTCIEFGAWDGVLLSNTANLWTNGWKGVLIEADKEKFSNLQSVVAEYDCVCINSYVTPVGINSLENLLKSNNIDIKSVKILSVDIDGNEYHILKNLGKLRPPVIIAEYNPTIPADMHIVSKEDSFFGSSALALKDLTKTMGYELVAITRTNCIFVTKDLYSKFSNFDTSYSSLFDSSNLTYLITGYNGDYVFSRAPSFSMGLPFPKEKIIEGQLTHFSHSHGRVKWNRIKDQIKRIGKPIIGVKNIEFIKYWSKYVLWNIKNKPVPAHMAYKRKILLSCARRHKLDTFVETGTAGGGSIVWMAQYFKELYTIELDPTLYHQSKALGYKHKNINFILGDSGVIIKELIEKIKKPALFWLDAHYSGAGTAKGDFETPIIKELQTIFDYKNKHHVIVIDDMREFNGTHDYPTLEKLKNFLDKYNEFYSYRQDNDLMIIEPK